MTPLEKKLLLVFLCALGQVALAAWIVFLPRNHPAPGRRYAVAVILGLCMAAVLIAATHDNQ